MNEIWLITGPMFSNKTKKLIQQIKFVSRKTNNFIVFKSKKDTRKTKNIIFSRHGPSMPAIPVFDHNELWKIFNERSTKPDFVFINEINFFSEEIIPIIKKIAAMNTKVICDGLLKDYKNQYFPVSQELSKIATKVFYQVASCVKCFSPAKFSKRLSKEKAVFFLGNKNTYEARCEKCYF